MQGRKDDGTATFSFPVEDDETLRVKTTSSALPTGAARDPGVLSYGWSAASSGTARQLAPPYSARGVIVAKDARAVTVGGVAYLLIATTGGTIRTTGTAAVVGVADGLSDGGDSVGPVVWSVRLAPSKPLYVFNRSTGSDAIRVGDATIQETSVVPSGAYGPLAADPTASYFVAASGTPVLEVAVSS